VLSGVLTSRDGLRLLMELNKEEVLSPVLFCVY